MVEKLNSRLEDGQLLTVGTVIRATKDESAFAEKFSELELTKIGYIEANLMDRATVGSDATAWKFLEARLPEKYGRHVNVKVEKTETLRLEIIRKQIVSKSAELNLTGGVAGAIEGVVDAEIVSDDDE